MKVQGINLKQYNYLSFLGMYTSYDKTTTWRILVMAKPPLDMP